LITTLKTYNYKVVPNAQQFPHIFSVGLVLKDLSKQSNKKCTTVETTIYIFILK